MRGPIVQVIGHTAPEYFLREKHSTAKIWVANGHDGRGSYVEIMRCWDDILRVKADADRIESERGAVQGHQGPSHGIENNSFHGKA